LEAQPPQDDPILTEPVARAVNPLYSDLSAFTVATYTKEEILAEKMRALLQQQTKWPRPHDLYDLWFILCHEMKARSSIGRGCADCSAANAERGR
jgi:predicted nucleotidyltransferase component of viral defense system